jgi:hypothetical protein
MYYIRYKNTCKLWNVTDWRTTTARTQPVIHARHLQLTGHNPLFTLGIFNWPDTRYSTSTFTILGWVYLGFSLTKQWFLTFYLAATNPISLLLLLYVLSPTSFYVFSWCLFYFNLAPMTLAWKYFIRNCELPEDVAWTAPKHVGAAWIF